MTDSSSSPSLPASMLSSSALPSGHPPIAAPQIGVLLVNLGSCDAPTASAVRRYLREFLSDRRVIEIPQILWQPILRGIVLNVRPRKSAQAYAQIWRTEGSPLVVITSEQAAQLQRAFGDAVLVRYAMRYGSPAIADELDVLIGAGCRRILVAPLYPQYCAATTASVVDKVAAHLGKLRWQPSLRFLPPYYEDASYIAALAASVQAELEALGEERQPEVLLASFHGMPQRTLERGDPYHCHCRKTARLLSERLDREVLVAFQSRFGRAQWLEPSTEAEIARLASEGVRRLAIVAPGFAADCLETLEELAIRGREQFIDAGGAELTYLPCLNASRQGMDMIEALVRRELAGWL